MIWVSNRSAVGLAVTLAIVGCDVPKAETPDSVAPASAAPAPAPKGSDNPRYKRHIRRCVEGQFMTPERATELREEWENIGDVLDQARGGRAPLRAGSLGEVCASARGFVENCPAWDADLASIAKEVC